MENLNPRSELLPEPAWARQGDILIGRLCVPDAGRWEAPEGGWLVLFEDMPSKARRIDSPLIPTTTPSGRRRRRRAYFIRSCSVLSIRWSELNAVALKVVEPCQVEHPTHRPILLTPGKYKVTLRRTYRPDPKVFEQWRVLKRRTGEDTRFASRWAAADRLNAAEVGERLANFLIHRDPSGELFLIPYPIEPLVFVRSSDIDAEAAGGTVGPFLRVPPAMKTAHEAIAWTFGVSPADYHPVLQT